MHEEFEQLLEALWEGRLDAQDRQRLESLAVADPALARRWSEEQRLSGLLASIGPCRPPRNLVAGVFERLASEQEASAPVPAESPERRERAIGWGAWLIPTWRWGAALAAVVLLVEVSILVRQNEPPATAVASKIVTDELEPAQRPPTMLAKAPTRAESRTPKATPPPAAETNVTPAPTRTPAEMMLAQAPKTGETDSSRNTAPHISIADQTKPPSPTIDPDAASATPQPLTPTPVAEIAATPQPITTPPAEVMLAGQSAPDAQPLERRVTLQVMLPAPRGAASVGAGGRGGRSALTPMQGMNALRGAGDAQRTFSADLSSGNDDVASSATRRDIETAVATAGGRIDEIRPLPAQPGWWEVRCTVTPPQFQSVLRQLGSMGLRPAETIAASPANRAMPGSDQTTSGGLNRFDRLKSLGVEVVVSNPPSATAPPLPDLAPNPAVGPGRYTVLEGANLLPAPDRSPAGGPNQRTSVVPLSPTVGDAIELILLVHQP